MRSGGGMLLGINQLIQAFIPKDVEEHETNDLIRDTSATRPLGLKNTINKAIVAVINATVKRAIAKSSKKFRS